MILPALRLIGYQNALATKILLATCTRISELSGAKWEHVDLDRAEWIIPHSKGNDRAFTIPLCPPVVGWFRELKTYAFGSTFVLPARQARRTARLGGDAPMNQLALNAMLHKLCVKLSGKVRRFTPHDLRSTARSHLAALGVPVIVAERCLNHSLGGLLAIYDQHDYIAERRGALERWTEFLVSCDTGQSRLQPAASRRSATSPRSRSSPMNRLDKLKGWFTAAEAAKRLTVSLAAPCKAADVLRLGLDQRLGLSVQFMSPVRLLRIGSALIPGQPDKSRQASQEGERRTATPAEIWDLPLTGSERASRRGTLPATGWR